MTVKPNVTVKQGILKRPWMCEIVNMAYKCKMLVALT